MLAQLLRLDYSAAGVAAGRRHPGRPPPRHRAGQPGGGPHPDQEPHPRRAPSPAAGAPGGGDLFSRANLRWLATVELDPAGRQSLDRQLRLLEQVEAELAWLNQQMAEHAWRHPSIQLLMTRLAANMKFPGFRSEFKYLRMMP